MKTAYMVAVITLLLLLGFSLLAYKCRNGVMWGKSYDEARVIRIKAADKSHEPITWFAWYPVRLYKAGNGEHGGRWVWLQDVIETYVTLGFTAYNLTGEPK